MEAASGHRGGPERTAAPAKAGRHWRAAPQQAGQREGRLPTHHLWRIALGNAPRPTPPAVPCCAHATSCACGRSAARVNAMPLVRGVGSGAVHAGRHRLRPRRRHRLRSAHVAPSPAVPRRLRRRSSEAVDHQAHPGDRATDNRRRVATVHCSVRSAREAMASALAALVAGTVWSTGCPPAAQDGRREESVPSGWCHAPWRSDTLTNWSRA